jgi:hypothetical protein
MRGLFPIGKTASSTGSTLLGTGGSTTISTSNMPSHTHVQDAHNHTQNSHNHTQDAHNHTQNAHAHDVTDPLHAHTIFQSGTNPVDNTGVNGFVLTGASAETVGGGRGMDTASTGISINNQTATNIATTATNQVATATNIATTATNQSTGGGTAYFQPFIAVNYIIKHD